MLWVSGPLPWYAEASINSFLHHGHRVELYSYDPPPNLPRGCVARNAAQILPPDCIFVYRAGHHHGNLSGFSNWFRYALLARHGGWWSDCDVVCVAPFTDGGKDYVFASEHKPPNPRSVNSNVIFVKHSATPIMLECLSYCEAKRDNIDHAESGPVLLNRLVNAHDLSGHIAGPSVFNPISYDDTNLLLDPTVILTLKKYSRRIRRLRPIHLSGRTLGVHLYASVLTNCGTVMSSADAIPGASFLAQLVRRHCRPRGVSHTATAERAFTPEAISP
jgi:hypothetical protein